MQEYRRKVLQTAKEYRRKLEAVETNDEYRMPDSYDKPGEERTDLRYAVANQRYRCVVVLPQKVKQRFQCVGLARQHCSH